MALSIPPDPATPARVYMDVASAQPLWGCLYVGHLPGGGIFQAFSPRIDFLMADTQTGGLGSHKVRRWRDGKAGQSHITKANQGNEARKALCSLRLLLFHFRFGPTTFCALPKRLL
jgi:hypothetical protein